MDLDLGIMLNLVGLYGFKPNIKEPNLIRFIIGLLGFFYRVRVTLEENYHFATIICN